MLTSITAIKFIVALAIAGIVAEIIFILFKALCFIALAIVKQKASVNINWNLITLFVCSLIVALYFIW